MIADQARIHRDLKPMGPADEATIELKIVTNRRTDLVRDRTRAINRLRSTLTGIFPAVERVLVLTSAGPLILLDGHQTPAAIRHMGTARLTRWLYARGVRTPEELAATAVEAANQQHTAVPGEALIAQQVRTLAVDVRVLNEKVAEADRLIEDRFRAHELAEIITSMPGIGPLLGAEFLAGVGTTSPSSRRRTGSPPLPGSRRRRMTRARRAATSTVPATTTAVSSASSTCPP